MALFNLGMGEITVILLLAMIFLGPKKLPELASGLGKLIREIRKTTADVKNEIQLDEAIRKPFEELRDAVTLPPEELKRRDRVKRELAELQKQAEEMAKNMPSVTAGTTTEGETGNATVGSEEPGTVSDPLHPAASAAEYQEAGATPGPQIAVPLLADSGVPGIPGAAPIGTVARESSGSATPPAPPIAALSARGSGPINVPERRLPGPSSSGSDFLRQLRNVPEGKRGTPATVPAQPVSAADRSNITQNLSEADLAAITVGPPPPPGGQKTARAVPPSVPPYLPGATPPKKPEPTT